MACAALSPHTQTFHSEIGRTQRTCELRHATFRMTAQVPSGGGGGGGDLGWGVGRVTL